MKVILLLIVFSMLIVSCGKDDKKTEYSEEKSPNTLQQESDKKSADEIKENTDSSNANDNPPNNNSTNKRYESFDDEKPVAVITPMDAGDYNGKTVTVKGFVADIYKNE